MSNNNNIKDPRLLFNVNNKNQDAQNDKLDKELRCLTHEYCLRMVCCSHYIHPKIDKELKALDITNLMANNQNIDNLYLESMLKCIEYYHYNNYLMCLLYTTSFIEKLLGDSLLNLNNNDKIKDIPHNIIMIY